SGHANFDDDSTDLAVSFNTDHMPKLLDRIGVLDDRQRAVFKGGKVSVEGRLKGGGPQQPVSAQATIHAREFQLQPFERPVLTYPLLEEGSVELNAARTDLELNKIGMTLKSHGKPAGTLTLAGTWPTAASQKGGAITISTKDLDAAPLVHVFELFPGREQGPI